jgi:adenylate kinase family enzyme
MEKIGHIQLLITGGPGSGATTIGLILSQKLSVPQIDSDDYFHKPTDPPFQEQYSPDERRRLLQDALAKSQSWILSGSISAWGIDEINFSHAVLLNIGKYERLKRLKVRESGRFASRIETGGDMFEEHTSFIDWASHYEAGDREGRSLPIERKFISKHSKSLLEINEVLPLEKLEELITISIEIRRITVLLTTGDNYPHEG